MNNLIGQIIGTLTVLTRAGRAVGGHIRWDVICNCGHRFNARGDYLLAGRSRCGACKVAKGPGSSKQPLAARLIENSEFITESGCQIWLGSLAGSGYGEILIDGKRTTAHRVSWVVQRGPIPDGLWVLHRCDVRPCINPDHLFLGDVRANVADMMAKRRHYSHRRI